MVNPRRHKRAAVDTPEFARFRQRRAQEVYRRAHCADSAALTKGAMGAR